MKTKHHLSYCDTCCDYMVICATCGNNCCNGGSGKINGDKCPDCDDAYEVQSLYHADPNLIIEFSAD